MSAHRNGRTRGFTLVEMLVVVAIIAILAAILIPAAMGALNASRRAANGVEIADLIKSIELTKSDHGGVYPPSFDEAQAIPAPVGPTTYAALFGNDPDNDGVGDGTYRNTVLYRYLVKAYPKAVNHEIKYMFLNVADNLDQSSALWFWLSQTSEDARYPFTGPARTGGGRFYNYHAFDEGRLVAAPRTIPEFVVNQNLTIPERPTFYYRPRFAGETYYVYIEARHYRFHVEADLSTDHSSCQLVPAGPSTRTAELCIRPYLKQNPPNALSTNVQNYVNPEGFQLFCAGLDGRMCVNQNWLRKFPSGEAGLRYDGSPLTYEEFADERDNQTNFSEGQQIQDVAAN